VEWALGAEYRRRGQLPFRIQTEAGVWSAVVGSQQDILACNSPREKCTGVARANHAATASRRRSGCVRRIEMVPIFLLLADMSRGRRYPLENRSRLCLPVELLPGFRAAALSELYVAQGVGVDSEVDPCGTDRIPRSGPTVLQTAYRAVRTSNRLLVRSCNRWGKSASRAGTRVLVDGGIDWRSQIFSGLHASLDVYQISLTNYIEAPNDEQVFSAADGRAGCLWFDPARS